MSSIMIFLLIFMVLLITPRLWRFSFGFLTSIFQVYTFPFFGFFPSLALVSQFSLSPALISLRKRLLQPPIIFLILLMSVQAISLAWSSDIKLGFATLLYEIPFLTIYLVALDLAMHNQQKLITLIKAYAILSLFPLSTLIFFRLYHQWNIEFLKSDFAKLIINPNTITAYFIENGLSYFSDATSSFKLSPFSEFFNFDFGSWTKPRGFFINPNVAAGYAGICALLFYGIGISYDLIWLKRIAFLHWLSIFVTLSVAAITLAITIPLLINFSYKSKIATILKLILGGTVFTSFLTMIFNPSLLALLIYKIKSRFVFWQVAAAILPNHLLLGLGFGGWEKPYAAYCASLAIPNVLLTPHSPPHNTFIQLLAQSGFFAALFAILFMCGVMLICWRALKLANNPKDKLAMSYMIGGILWVFIQGMGENWGIVGEIHIQPLFAILLALVTVKLEE